MIGTWATGSGEGLASMAEVRALQLAQAWLLASGPAPDADAAARARALLGAAESDPNRIAERHAAHMAALHRRLGG